MFEWSISAVKDSPLEMLSLTESGFWWLKTFSDVVMCCEVKERSSCGKISQLKRRDFGPFRLKSIIQTLFAIHVVWYSLFGALIFNKIVADSWQSTLTSNPTNMSAVLYTPENPLNVTLWNVKNLWNSQPVNSFIVHFVILQLPLVKKKKKQQPPNPFSWLSKAIITEMFFPPPLSALLTDNSMGFSTVVSTT